MDLGPFEEGKLGLGRDIEIPVADPAPNLARSAKLLAGAGAVVALVGFFVPFVGPLFVLGGLALCGLGGYRAALAHARRDRNFLRLDRSRLALPRVALVGPTELEIPLADVVSAEVVDEPQGRALVVKTRDESARLAAADLPAGVELAEVQKRITIRRELARKGRVRRATLIGAEAMALLPASAPIVGVVVGKKDGHRAISAIVTDAAELPTCANEVPDGLLVVADERREELQKTMTDPSRLA